MGNHCGCGHDDNEKEQADDCCGSGCCGESHSHEEHSCGCGHDHAHTPPSPEEIAELMKAIEAAGYKVEEAANGEIKISEK